MEGIMEGREHLTSNENSLFIGSIDSDFEGDDLMRRQEKKTKAKNWVYCMYFPEKIQLYISPFSLYFRACRSPHLSHLHSLSQ